MWTEDGRPDGSLRRVEHHAAVLEAVVAAVPGLFVNARTDTYWLRVGTDDERLPETLRRLTAYREASAHGVFVPGLTELAAAGVARVSTGSALYRHALTAAVETARVARGEPPTTAGPVGYGTLQDLFRDN